MAARGEHDQLEALVIEGNASIAQQVASLLGSTPAFRVRILAPDRPLTAQPGWAGPDVLLVGLDSDRSRRLASAQRVVQTYPGAIVIGYTSNYTAETLAEAMERGTRRVLRFPFDVAVLQQTVFDLREELRNIVGHGRPPGDDAAGLANADATDSSRNRVVAIFSPKGGAGCSTLAVNLAVALQTMGSSTVLVDGNISFGSVDVFLNLQPTRSILQLVGDVDTLTSDAIAETLVEHSTGLRVLMAPMRPEEGDSIRGEHMQRICSVLKQSFRFTLVDTWPSFDERVLAVLEIADTILVPIGPDLPAMKNLNQFLRVAQLLNYDMNKITLILMRANSVPPGHLKDIEKFLNRPLRWRVVSDGKRATEAANTGTPFVLSARSAPISQNVLDIAKSLIGESGQGAEKGKPQSGGRFWRR